MHSDSDSFYEDDRPELLTIESLDTIKIMADVEEDVKRRVADQIKNLEGQLREKDYMISQLQDESDQLKIQYINKQRDENDNYNLRSSSVEDHLEGSGENSLVSSSSHKLLRLQSVHDQAKAEIRG